MLHLSTTGLIIAKCYRASKPTRVTFRLQTISCQLTHRRCFFLWPEASCEPPREMIRAQEPRSGPIDLDSVPIDKCVHYYPVWLRLLLSRVRHSLIKPGIHFILHLRLPVYRHDGHTAGQMATTTGLHCILPSAVGVTCSPLQLGALLDVIAQRQSMGAANEAAMRRAQSRGAAPGPSRACLRAASLDQNC